MLLELHYYNYYGNYSNVYAKTILPAGKHLLGKLQKAVEANLDLVSEVSSWPNLFKKKKKQIYT